MTTAAGLRKVAVTAHVTSAVGWLGAVACSLTLALAAVTTDAPATVRAAYLSLEVVGWYVLVPMSLASLLSGLLCSLGSTWGLFRHYWVVTKLAINVVACLVLLMYMETLEYLAHSVDEGSAGDVLAIRSWSPVLHAGTALVLLVVATVLGVYKPRGLTRYGWRKQEQRRARCLGG